MIPFVNREKELEEIAKLRGLIVIIGRRRVGKTSLIIRSLTKSDLYSQAIQSSKELQLQQVYDDIKQSLSFKIEPKSWVEFFEILDISQFTGILCLDEFPYLVASDPSLPSIIQRWIDHRKNKQITLILSGSSQRIMYHTFLDQRAPLYGRATKILNIAPMNYSNFCQALDLQANNEDAFQLFSLVGGIPRYWELLDTSKSVLENAENLYFYFSAFLENEPQKLLIDEKMEGMAPINVFEAIGRGAHRVSEIATKTGISQTDIYRPLSLLQGINLIKREIPFGELEKNSKKSLYFIVDPVILFWYSVYSPHRSRWHLYSVLEKERLIRQHASVVFEAVCRKQFKESKRYWEKNLEIDIVYQKDLLSIELIEVKFKFLEENERKSLLSKLEIKYKESKLSQKYIKISFKICDLNYLSSL